MNINPLLKTPFHLSLKKYSSLEEYIARVKRFLIRVSINSFSKSSRDNVSEIPRDYIKWKGEQIIMWDWLMNMVQGNTQTTEDTSSPQSAAPIVSYTINCGNQPDKEQPTQNTVQPEQSEQPPVLAEVPFHVDTRIVHNEDDLFQVMYNRIVAKLEADKDASSAGAYQT